jgi:hypothetical protein
MTTAINRLISKADEQHTDTLIGALALLPSMDTATAAERLTHMAICTALEERIPAAEALMVTWSELEWGVELTYAEALIVAIAQVTA